eukprot:TRINITY_DN1379_c5_g1_i1.p1 TRINITY_DN1379_c5_g1~~TRINITY_DN1379_c5_g1_i1.p1  ORF type:complete len:379 (+),score=49.70 TRINITY_DN1379_c5_g1_i1:61-1197(+)
MRPVLRLYRAMMAVGKELDGIDPARKALFLGVPQVVWDEAGQRQVKLTNVSNSKQHTYESIVRKFNSNGVYFKPVEEKSVLDHVRMAFRSRQAKFNSSSFEALRQMQLVLASAKKLPPRKRVQKRNRSHGLKVISGIKHVSSTSGRLLVGHPLASISQPLLHRSLVIIDNNQKKSHVRGLILNRPTQKTVRSAINPNWGKQHFGDLLDQKLWVGGDNIDQGFSIIHKWGDIKHARELIPGLYVNYLQDNFAKGDYSPVHDIRERIKKENITHNEISGCLRILLGGCTWSRSELELMIGNNSWMAVAPSTEYDLQQYCINNRRCDYDSWKAVLNATDASALSGIPPLDSPFGESYRILIEDHHRKVQALRDSALKATAN